MGLSVVLFIRLADDITVDLFKAELTTLPAVAVVVTETVVFLAVTLTEVCLFTALSMDTNGEFGEGFRCVGGEDCTKSCGRKGGDSGSNDEPGSGE